MKIENAVKGLESSVKISIQNLKKDFESRKGRIKAIDSISLNIHANEFCMIVGPSGCGKTTLLRILARLENQTSGEVIYRQSNPAQPLANMVFQQQAVFPWMTVWENIAFGLKRRGIKGDQLKSIVDHYIGVAGLTGFANYHPHELSGGMKQRVGVARAFANDPEVLLMDEPFGSLDEQNKTILQDELLRIWEGTQKTVVFITHSIDEAISLGDRVIVMTSRPGRIKAVVPVTFPRPRRMMKLRTEPEYGKLVYYIWQMLQEEVDASRQQAPTVLLTEPYFDFGGQHAAGARDSKGT